MDSSAINFNLFGLPDNVILIISTKFKTQNDIVRFRAVCKKFKTIVPIPPKKRFKKSSLKIPFPIGFPTLPYAHYEVAESTVYAITPLHGAVTCTAPTTTSTWVVKVEELDDSGRVKLKDMFSRFVSRNLNLRLPQTLNLLEHEVTALTKSYELEIVRSHGYDESYAAIALLWDYSLEKVVVSENFDAVMGIRTDESDIVVWRHGDESWSDLSYLGSGFDNIIYNDKKFYAINSNGVTFTVDCRTLAIIQVTNNQNKFYGQNLMMYFVNLQNNLFLISKYRLKGYPFTSFVNNTDVKYYPVEFGIFKLKNCEWVETCDGFENRAIFLDLGSSFSLPANENAGIKGNCIYFSDLVFTDDVDSGVYEDYPGRLSGIFDLLDFSVKHISAFPGYSQIFWPPPAWLL